MKRFALTFFILLAGCSGSNTPIGIIPGPPPVVGTVKFYLPPYQETLDTLYFKIWSDSSGMEYGGRKSFGADTFSVLLDNLGNEYYYGPGGYSGFTASGQSAILFDTPLGAWPDSLPINGTFTQSTTFAYGGNTWTMSDYYRLLDTSAASAAFGVFDPCIHLQNISTASVAGQGNSSTSEFWMAKGPGQIVQADNLGNSITMVRGQVNGRYWGIGAAKPAPARTLGKAGRENILHVACAWLARRMFTVRGKR